MIKSLSRFQSSVLLAAGLTAFFVVALKANMHNIDLTIAWHGYSPLAFVYKAFYPSDFARDFPGGFENFDKSAFMHIYTLAYKYLHIDPSTLLMITSGLQMLLLGWAMFLLLRTLFPQSDFLLPFILLALVFASYGRNMDLARYAKPTGHLAQFLYYDITDAFRIFAVVAALKSRYVLAAFILALTCIVYPTLGLMGAFFILPMLLVTGKDLKRSHILSGLFLFTAIVVPWVIVKFSSGSGSAQLMPDSLWYDLTALGSYHLYPVEMGMFTWYHDERFIQFLSFLLLISLYITQRNPLRDEDKKMAAGMISALAITAAGVFISAVKPHPTLVKLSLHRANDLIVLTGLVYVSAGLWNDVRQGSVWNKSIALAILLSPFILQPGYPLLYSLLLVLPSFRSLRHEGTRSPLNYITLFVLLAIIALMVVYTLSGLRKDWTADVYSGGLSLSVVIIVSGIIFSLPRLVPDRIRLSQGLAMSMAAMAVIIMALLWLKDNRFDALTTEKEALASSYMDVQMWAQHNSPATALFMTDPTMAYSWRDYSRRSSFGTLREWLFSGWLYRSDREVYQEGFRRFNEFHLSLDNYLHASPPLSGWDRLTRDVRESYFSSSDTWKSDLAERYGIDYFVMTKSEMRTQSSLAVAYENAHFTVLEP